jgi:hypothetical protein
MAPCDGDSASLCYSPILAHKVDALDETVPSLCVTRPTHLASVIMGLYPASSRRCASRRSLPFLYHAVLAVGTYRIG